MENYVKLPSQNIYVHRLRENEECPDKAGEYTVEM